MWFFGGFGVEVDEEFQSHIQSELWQYETGSDSWILLSTSTAAYVSFFSLFSFLFSLFSFLSFGLCFLVIFLILILILICLLCSDLAISPQNREQVDRQQYSSHQR